MELQEDWVEYIRRTRRTPAMYEVWTRPDGSEWKIGVWYQSMQQKYRKGSLPEYHVQMLENLPGWAWGGIDELELRWKQSYIVIRAASRRKRLWLPDEIWQQMIAPLVQNDD